MLREFTGKLWNRGKLIKFDYWLCWILLGAEPDDYFDFEFFRKGWLWRNYHVTKQRLNFCDSVFNAKESAFVLDNKLEFYRRWNSWLKREWCIPQDVTFEEFQLRFGDKSRILVKPTSLYGGKGIYALDITPENLNSVYEQLHGSCESILVEEFVFQNGYLHDIYPMSLNTLRVCTIQVGETADVCFAFFRAGCGGNIVDNASSGGIYFPIDVATGRMGIGHGQKSNGHRKHPDTGIEVTGNCVPDWKKIKEFACEAHRLAPKDVRFIGWDICWSDGELSLIEGNTSPGTPDPDRHENQWRLLKMYLDRAYHMS